MLIPIERGTLVNPDKVNGAYIVYDRDKDAYKLTVMFDDNSLYCYYETYDDANNDLEYLMECANAGYLKD